MFQWIILTSNKHGIYSNSVSVEATTELMPKSLSNSNQDASKETYIILSHEGSYRVLNLELKHLRMIKLANHHFIF